MSAVIPSWVAASRRVKRATSEASCSSFQASANSYANRYIIGMPDAAAEGALTNGATSGVDQMFGMLSDNP